MFVDEFELIDATGYINGIPICGHYFWNNLEGVTGFCNSLGYQYGFLRETRTEYGRDSAFVGTCATPNDFPNCEHEDTSEGRVYEVLCNKGGKAGVELFCSNGNRFMLQLNFRMGCKLNTFLFKKYQPTMQKGIKMIFQIVRRYILLKGVYICNTGGTAGV